MAIGDLIAGLSAVPQNHWVATSDPDQAGMVSWLPLTQISSSGIWLGLNRQGVWALGRLDGRVESSADQLPSSWVTVLESSEDALRDGLNHAAERFKLSSEDLQYMVPVQGILTMAIRSRSAYWAERAVQWISQEGSPCEHLNILEEVSKAKWVNQQTRHAAWRLKKHCS